MLSALDKIVPADRLIASNTSTLSITQLARATAHPQRLAGLHFFSPAHIMKLLEIVRGKETAPQILGVTLQVSRLLKKIGVVANDGFGFIGNRMMLDGYFREAEQLLLEGASPSDVDGALERFGFAMGPQRVSDLGGTDVGTKARVQLYKRESRPDPYFAIADKLTELGRLGQKTGAGFYRYAPGGRDALADPEVTAVIEKLAAERGIQRRTIPAAEIIERCVLSLILVAPGCSRKASLPGRPISTWCGPADMAFRAIWEDRCSMRIPWEFPTSPSVSATTIRSKATTGLRPPRSNPWRRRARPSKRSTRSVGEPERQSLHRRGLRASDAQGGRSLGPAAARRCCIGGAGRCGPVDWGRGWLLLRGRCGGVVGAGIGPFSAVEYLGLNLRHLDTTESWGSAYINHVEHAVQAIAAGKCRIALITLAGRPRAEAVNPDSQHGLVKDAAEFEFEGPYKPVVTNMYGMVAKRHMYHTAPPPSSSHGSRSPPPIMPSTTRTPCCATW